MANVILFVSIISTTGIALLAIDMIPRYGLKHSKELIVSQFKSEETQMSITLFNGKIVHVNLILLAFILYISIMLCTALLVARS